jgi:ketosteroid isomerase-like protein
MSEDNVEIVRRLYEAWGKGEYSAALDSIDPEVEVDLVVGGLALDGAYRGHGKIAEMQRAFWAEFEDPQNEIEELIPIGDDVVVRVRFSGRGKRSGIKVDMLLWHMWRLREGKVVRWWLRPSKREALEAAGLTE